MKKSTLVIFFSVFCLLALLWVAWRWGTGSTDRSGSKGREFSETSRDSAAPQSAGGAASDKGGEARSAEGPASSQEQTNVPGGERRAASSGSSQPGEPITFAPPGPGPAGSPRPPDPEGERISRAQAALADAAARPRDLSVPGEREALVAELRTLEDEIEDALRAKAAALGIAFSGTRANGNPFILRGFDGDVPLYEEPENVNAAISTAAEKVRNSVLFPVNGTGWRVGVWESGGIPRITHQEFGGRVVRRDSSNNPTAHATHVAGTIAGSGASANALGMAPLAQIDAYDSSNALSEMTASGMAVAAEAGKLQISNHSYGFRRGWNFTGGNWIWLGTYTGSPATDADSGFGRYDNNARTYDGLAYNLPYYLPAYSNGNMRSTGPPSAGTTWYQGSTSGTSRTYDAAAHPRGNGVYKSQYDTMDGLKTAKNILSVGAANDAVLSGQRRVASGTISSFSSTGPTDDGRIKPDVVGNGVSLYSATSGSDSSYSSLSGTSMSTPNVVGSATLLMHYYAQRFPGEAMRASTLKGLLIHTADDLGNPGPDYFYGWGLVNTEAAAHLIRDQAEADGFAPMTEARLAPGDNVHSYPFVWNGVDPIRATLCWTDPAGSSTTAHDSRDPRLVNDLNLTLHGPGGALHRPYVMPYVGNWSPALLSAPAITGVNHTDNVEQVYLAAPTPGVYTLVVNHAGALTNNEQSYSLLVTGGGSSSDLAVTPVGGFEAVGAGGGPFSPAQTTYTLANTGSEPVAWSVGTNQAWVSASPSSGNVPVGGQAVVTVSFTPAAAALPTGAHAATVAFNNLTSGTVSTRVVTLEVTGPQTILFDEIPTQLAPEPLTLAATGGGSGNPVVFTLNSGPAVLDGNVLYFTGTGSVSVTANQAGGPTHGPATAVTRVFEVVRAAQVLDFHAIPAQTAIRRVPLVVQGGDPAVEAEFEIISGPGVIEENAPDAPTAHSLVFTGAGTVVVDASKPEGPFWEPAAPVSRQVAVTLEPQAIQFASIADVGTFGSVTISPTGGGSGNLVELVVTQGVGGPVSFFDAVALQNTKSLSFVGTGTVSITATQAGNALYAEAPPVTRTFQVTKAVANVQINGLSQAYDGSGRGVTVTTSQPGLTVSVTYDGSPDVPVDAGVYEVVATIVGSSRYEGSLASELRVDPGAGRIILSGLVQRYDGSSKVPFATTLPPGLEVEMTYDGEIEAPSESGFYKVVATLANPNYSGRAEADFLINRDPELRILGRSVLKTRRSRQIVRGSAFDPEGSLREVNFLDNRPKGRPSWRKARGTARWTATVLLRRGRNTVSVQAVDLHGGRSRIERMRVIAK